MDILTAIQNSGVAHSISKSNHLIAASLQVIHVIGFILLLASLVLISLRILKLALRHQSLPEITRNATQIFWVGLVFVVLSGGLMFIATPKLYVSKWAFNLKMLLFVAAIALQFTFFRKAANSQTAPTTFTKISVIVSLLIWFSVSFAGRIIGFI